METDNSQTREKTMTTQYEYFAAIGDRMIKVRGRNIWEAAEKAACNFSGSVREGLLFFRGEADLQVSRVGGGRVQSGSFDKWMSIFAAQGRSTKRWDKVQTWAHADICTGAICDCHDNSSTVMY